MHGTRRNTRGGRAPLYLRPRWTNPLARSKSFKFTFNDDNFLAQCSAAQGRQSLYYFRGNSLFDPDATGVGVQPYGYDQTTAIYTTYQVLASKITVYFTPSTDCEVLKCFVFPYTDTSVAFTDPSDVRRIPGCKSVAWGYGGGSSKHNIVKNYGSNKKVYPLVSGKEFNYWTQYNANPTTQWYWVVMFDSSGNQSVDGTYNAFFDVKITYYARMNTMEDINES